MDIIRDPSVLTENWNLLGNVYYRKWQLYQMEWSDETKRSNNDTLSIAKYCGPIAKRFYSKSTKQTFIAIYTQSGSKLCQIEWKGETIFSMFWTVDEELWIVTQFGKLVAYSLLGLLKYEIQLVNGQRVSEAKILNPLKKDPCLAIMTIQKNLILYPFIKEKSDKALAFSFKEWLNIPRCWDLIWIGSNSHPTIVVCDVSNNKYIHAYSENSTLKFEIPIDCYYDEIVEMAASVEKNYIALLTNTNYLWIGSYDMSQKFAEINLSNHQHTIPLSIKWCGSGAIACVWSSMLVLFGPQQHHQIYYIQEDSKVESDFGCIHIIDSESHEIIQEIPNQLESIYLDSLHPGALLFDAFREYKKRSPKSLDLIEGIKLKLHDAVNACLLAAPEEVVPSFQKLILNAALFGQSFINSTDPNYFYRTCRLTQILNQLRAPTIGIPFTNYLFQSVEPIFVINKLKTRGFYGLAVEICTSLNYDKHMLNEAFIEWAHNKMLDSTMSDDELLKLLLEKSKRYPSISMIQLGSLSIAQNRKQLAIGLMEHIVDPHDHVPLLLRLDQTQKALQIAMRSGDIDLVFIVIFYLRKNLSTTQFLMKIRSDPHLFGLCRRYYLETKNYQMLMSLYEQDDLVKFSACQKIDNSYSLPVIERIPQMNSICALVGNKSVIHTAMKETIKLYEYQRKLHQHQNYTHLHLIGLTLNQTLQRMLSKGFVNEAENLRRELYVPEIRFQWLVVSSLAQAHEWSKLSQFSIQKKPLIGYMPFVEACIQYNAPRKEIEFYLPKIPMEERTSIYLYLRNYELAADSAIASKSANNIRAVLLKCSPIQDKSIYDKLDAALTLFK